MTFAPGLQSAVETMQALIDAAPKHPLYDIIVNTEAMRPGTAEIIIGWRGKVEWVPEENRRRSRERSDHVRFSEIRLPYVGIEQPEWGIDIATSVFLFDADPEGLFSNLRRMIDNNFLKTLENTSFTANKWQWARGARFA